MNNYKYSLYVLERCEEHNIKIIPGIKDIIESFRNNDDITNQVNSINEMIECVKYHVDKIDTKVELENKISNYKKYLLEICGDRFPDLKFKINNSQTVFEIENAAETLEIWFNIYENRSSL